ncbi:MAG: patatin-like phospholipase family protein [Moraxellaceae bacterium]|nr:patatin-like phospholipase family protein [Moraxellaceae bacterium]
MSKPLGVLLLGAAGLLQAWPAAQAASAFSSADRVADANVAPQDAAAIAATAPRPKIALVLSGGGARGLAHVGVFKALEKMRVPYDCIVGTSMGAIAGGTIASGTSVAEAERMVVDADWRYVFADKPRRSDTPYFRKREDYNNYFDFSLSLRDLQLQAPRNVAGVQHIGLFFRELTHATATDDFDKLPIPYRAIGTDIVTGEAVVLGEGMLAEAMRASMTVPGVFPPIPYRGHLLVDGGISMNLPVSEGRKLCGDVVIAVDVSTPVFREDQLGSLLSIGAQVIGISMQHNLSSQIATLTPTDVFIKPALDGYSAGDFAKARELIKIGEQAVTAHTVALQRYQLDEASYAVWRQSVAARQLPVPVLGKVSVAPTQWVNPRVMAGLLDVEPGQTFDMDSLHRRINTVFARRDFSSITYDVLPLDDDHSELYIVPEERPGRDFVRFGVSLYSDFAGQADFSALASLRRAWLNRLDAEWRTELEVGRDKRIFSEWYQPLSLQSELFVAPYVHYKSDFREYYLTGNFPLEYEFRATDVGLEVGSVFGRFGELRAGILSGHASIRPDAGSLLADVTEKRGGYTFSAIYDQLDDVALPQDGRLLRLRYFHSATALNADSEYERLEIEARQAMSFGRNSVLLIGRLGSSLETTLPFYENFTLGGIFNLSAYAPRRIETSSQVYGRVEGYRRISDLPTIIGKGIYAGALLETGWGWNSGGIEPPPLRDLPWSLGSYFAADTVVGPVYLMASVNDQRNVAAYLAVGFNF